MLAATADKLGEPLRSRLHERESWRVVVELAPQVDLRELGRRHEARRLSKRRRRAAVIAALKEMARHSQEALRPFIESARDAGLVRSWRGYTIVNSLLVEATPAGVEWLAGRPEVVAIAPESEAPGGVLQEVRPGSEPPETTSWGLAAIGAQAAWALGLDGRGIVVGAIDSGASAVHEQLAGGFRGGPRSWLDPRGGSLTPRDTLLGHGTGVLSCAVGGNRAGVTLGVAPAATWIACAGLPGGRYDNVLALDCADWMLTVGQPDVLLNAWLLPEAGCNRELLPLVEAWRAAEILPVFAAGNYGPTPGADRSPANYADLFPGGRAALAVGGLRRDSSVDPNSSPGPSACGGSVFPLLVAPGEDLVAAFPAARSTYLRARGTSFAAGLVAGAAALLLQRHPEALVVELEDALAGGAADLGPPGPDAATGHGRLDLPEALARLDRQRR